MQTIRALPQGPSAWLELENPSIKISLVIALSVPGRLECIHCSSRGLDIHPIQTSTQWHKLHLEQLELQWDDLSWHGLDKQVRQKFVTHRWWLADLCIRVWNSGDIGYSGPSKHSNSMPSP